MVNSSEKDAVVMVDELTGDNWDRAMRGLSDIELNLIMVGAKRGTLLAVGEPNNAMLAGFKAAKELVRRNSPPVPNKGGSTDVKQ